jgi:hypothetical protein
MFELAGRSPETAKAYAATVMRVETELAKGSLDRVSRRDPEKIYHPMKKADVATLAPTFQWEQYYAGAGAPGFQAIVVSSPEFFKTIDKQIQDVSLDDWKIYLEWHLLHSEAPLLPTSFLKENFDFYGKTLTGAKEMRPRWKRCVGSPTTSWARRWARSTSRRLSARRQGADLEDGSRARTRWARISRSCRMTDATKKEALVSSGDTNKIGYPKVADYSSIEIKPTTRWATVRADQFEFQRQLNKIGKPVDRLEWSMTPPTVNAYYDPQMNNINFPAAFCAAVLRQRDGRRGEFWRHRHGDRARADARLRRQGGSSIPRKSAGLVDAHRREGVPAARGLRGRSILQLYGGAGVHINGKLTLGENTADNGGVRVALMALLNTIGNPPEDRRLHAGAALLPVVRPGVVLNEREESVRLQGDDPHSPKFRVNGVVQNMPEFRGAFSRKRASRWSKKTPAASGKALRNSRPRRMDPRRIPRALARLLRPADELEGHRPGIANLYGMGPGCQRERALRGPTRVGCRSLGSSLAHGGPCAARSPASMNGLRAAPTGTRTVGISGLRFRLPVRYRRATRLRSAARSSSLVACVCWAAACLASARRSRSRGVRHRTPVGEGGGADLAHGEGDGRFGARVFSNSARLKRASSKSGAARWPAPAPSRRQSALAGQHARSGNTGPHRQPNSARFHAATARPVSPRLSAMVPVAARTSPEAGRSAASSRKADSAPGRSPLASRKSASITRAANGVRFSIRTCADGPSTAGRGSAMEPRAMRERRSRSTAESGV